MVALVCLPTVLYLLVLLCLFSKGAVGWPAVCDCGTLYFLVIFTFCTQCVYSCPEVIKLFSCSTKLSTKFISMINTTSEKL